MLSRMFLPRELLIGTPTILDLLKFLPRAFLHHALANRTNDWRWESWSKRRVSNYTVFGFQSSAVLGYSFAPEFLRSEDIKRRPQSPLNSIHLQRTVSDSKMFNGEYPQTPREDPSPPNLRSQAQGMNTTNGPSASGVQLQTASDGTHFDLSQLPQHLITPLIQGAFQHPVLQTNPGVYNGGPSHELSNVTAPGDRDVPIMSYGGPPPTLPNLPNGQAGNPSASFQAAGQPPTMPWRDLHPDVFATPDAQGVPGPLWRLIYAALDYEGGDDLRVVIHFRRIRSPL